MQAVILAGGRGTRLYPLTESIPKPMAPVAGRPFLEYQLDFLRRQSITEIVLLVGYLAEQIESHFGDGARFGLRIRYSAEHTPLGTGGALREAAPLLAGEFLLLNGDSFLPIDYHAPLALLHRTEAAFVMVVHNNLAEDSAVPNNVEVDPSGRVVRYRKTLTPDPSLTHVDAGVLACRRSIVDSIPTEGAVSLESQVYPPLIAAGRVTAYEGRCRFYDIGSPNKLTAFEAYLAQEGPAR